MDTGWVEMVAGVAEIIGEIIIPIFIDRDPSLTPEPKIHPALRPGASSTLSRLGFGMGGRL